MRQRHRFSSFPSAIHPSKRRQAEAVIHMGRF